MNQKSNSAIEKELVEAMASFQHDPLGWVYFAFEWGKGDLVGDLSGPDQWAITTLTEIGERLKNNEITGVYEAIQYAIASGHGIGKSCCIAWIVLWGLSTFEDTKIVVTANTESQLRTKTWPEIAKWFNRCIIKHWFRFNATNIHIEDPSTEKQKSWRCDMIPWSSENTEAFAGLHNLGKRIIVVFDEGSAIYDKIWDVTEGALTDEGTEILWVVFGNPTRNQGRFFDCFNRYRHRWINKQIDSRSARITNKKQLQIWVDDYGEDSDFVRVRVRGVFPKAGDRQFISSAIVEQARGRRIGEHQYSHAPVIIGVDPAWTGEDSTAIFMRQGLISKLLAVYPKNDNDSVIAGYVAKFEDDYKADAVFIDLGYGTGIYSVGKTMNREWRLVSFGSASNDHQYLNKRGEIWGAMKTWLQEGGCIQDNPTLCAEITGPEYIVRPDGKILIEKKEDMKRRGLASPNIADSLALTFSYPVLKKSHHKKLEFAQNEYNPFA